MQEKVPIRARFWVLIGIFFVNMANWIQKAIKKPGAFTAQAKGAGMSVAEYANKVLKKGSKASTTTKRRAVLAKTLRKLAKRRKKTNIREQRQGLRRR